ncbi:MAG: glycosyl hydrolase, partial [Verrucomicrobiota bacterium]
MKKNKMRLVVCCWLVSMTMAGAADTLEQAFNQPPAATKPRCYWYWMDGQITKVGITRDLEAMKRVGIGEGYIGVISGQSGTPTTSMTKALTDDWWSYIEHAVREGTRLGVDVGLFNSPGWSQSGGPWVKPSQAMRYVTLPELRLQGPQHFAGKLPLPPGEFKDLAVLAFPAPTGEGKMAKIISRTPTLVNFQMPVSFTARSVIVQPAGKVNVSAELLASDNGQQYWTVKKFTIDRHNLGPGVGPVPLAPVVATFPKASGRFFQLKFSAACELGDIQLSPAARVESFAEKSLQKVCQEPHPLYDFYTWPSEAEPDASGLVIKPDAVRNLSKLMAADGTLQWDVPAGDWIVLRSAMTPTGTKNGPAPPEATGLEVDKMNRTSLRSHFDAYVGDLLKRLPAADRKSWKHVVADSYEMGPENWTDGFATDFQKRYGYDPLPFLPVMTGRIVGSVDQSDRFLWDLRRLVADRVAHNYVGGLRDLCHEHGMKMWLENYGHWGFPSEFLLYGGDCDEIAGEFWANGNFLDQRDTGYLGRYELRDASSAANIYDKPVTWAEAFTGGPAFINSPRDLKARGDWAFCEGINQFVFHVYIHQPTDEKLPGVNAWFGTEFNRNNTWFEQSKAWIDYLRRCSVMLQAGKHVADVAYFISEDAPKMAGPQQPPLPSGFDYDFINADVIEHRLAVQDGRLTLPDGMSYRLLALPESATMRPGLLNKIRELVKAGATIVGTPPSRSPSLENFPKCDAEVQTLAREIWGNAAPQHQGEHPFGKGRVFWGNSLDPILAELKLKPDFENSAKLGFIHRHRADRDIYFVANPTAEPVTTTAAFRVGDRAPELWSPDSGRIDRPAVYDVADGVVRLPLSFGPAGSVFVVFREKAAPPAERIISVTRGGQEILGTAMKSAVSTGTGDVVSDNPDNFTFAVWVKPDDDITLVREANSGIVGMAELRNDVFFPPHGDGFGGQTHAGCGLAVGRNGVGVFEHSGNYFAPTLVYAATLTNWTHVAVVYRGGQPNLYLNGMLARTGLKSTHIVHSGAGHAEAKFRGKLGAIEQFSRPLSAAEIAQLIPSMRQPGDGASELPFQLTRTTYGRINAQGGKSGDYELKFADGHACTLAVPATAAPMEIAGPWEVSFPPGWGAP